MNLFPPKESLQVLFKKDASPKLFYWFKVDETDPEGLKLKEVLSQSGGKLLHWWRCEYTLIGPGKDHWTHAAILHFESVHALEKASQIEYLHTSLADMELRKLTLRMPPTLMMKLLKLLRPINWFIPKPKKITLDMVLHAFETEGGINPTRNQIQKHLQNQRKRPARMINLLDYHPKAQYPNPGKGDDISGGKAYNLRYGLVAIRSVIMMGGRLVCSGQLSDPIILAQEQDLATAGSWRGLGVMEYPNPSRLFHLERMPGYRKALKHRNAGLARTALIVAE